MSRSALHATLYEMYVWVYEMSFGNISGIEFLLPENFIKHGANVFLLFQGWYLLFLYFCKLKIKRRIKKCSEHNKPYTLPFYQQMTKKS